MSSVAALPPLIRAYLSDFVARDRWVRAVRAVGAALAVAMGAVLGICLVDRLVALPPWARLALLIAAGVAAAVPLVGAAWRCLGRAVDWAAVAAEIETRSPVFGQRLETVASQLLWPQRYRGSEQILGQLLADVTEQAQRQRPTGLVSWRPAFRPWALCAAILLVALALLPLNWLNLRQLLERTLRPWAALPAVSVTQLDVEPRGASVLQGDSLTLRVLGQRLGARSVVLYLSGDGKTWSQVEMTRTSPSANEFTFTLAGVDQDRHYYVRGGDAVSGIYDIRVKRVPAISEFRIDYTYPASTRRPAQTTINTDGFIEAPAGSAAEVSLNVTEPLASALLTIDGKPTPLKATADAQTWQTTLPLRVDHDVTCPLELTTLQGVVSSGLAITLHAVPDRPPLVRLLQPTQDLLLSPRDAVRLRYEAIDDYGIVGLWLHLRTGRGADVVETLHLRGDAQRMEGAYRLDLADLGLNVGDVLTLTATAEDTAHQTTSTEPNRLVLIVPRGVDQDTLLCESQLKSAVVLAGEWADELEQARRAWSVLLATESGAPNRQQLLVKANHASSDAADSAGALRTTLLRATARSRQPGLARTLADSADAVTLIGAGIAAAREVEGPAPLAASSDAARELSLRLRTLWQGESAAALLTQRSDLHDFEAATSSERANADKRRQAASLARLAINSAIVELGLNPGGADIDSQLQRFIDAARALAGAEQPPDWVALVGDWATHRDGPAGMLLSQRLELAALAQALEDGEDSTATALVWAGDLRLAARAVANIRLGAPAVRPTREDARTREARLRNEASQLGATLATLRAPPDAAAATAARVKLTACAEEPDLATLSPVAAARQMEALAFEANAQCALGNRDRCAALDHKLVEAIDQSSPEEAARLKQALARLALTMADLDRISALQTKLQSDTQSTADPTSPAFAALAARQRDIIAALAKLPRPRVIAAEVFGESSAESPRPAETETNVAAQATLIESDPLAAAKALAQLASDALASQPVDGTEAVALQREAVTAMQRAGQRALARSAALRLEMTPTLAPIFGWPVEGEMSSAVVGNWLRNFSGPRSSRRSEMPETEAPAFKDAVRAYFDDLVHPQNEKVKR